jgi:ABC-2 type transport system permease protein
MIVSNNTAFETNPQARGYFTLAILIMFGAYTMAGSIRADKIDGVIIRILAGPITFRHYLVQNFFAGLLPMVVLSAILSTLGMIIYQWELPFALAVMLTYILLSGTSIGLSFVWSCWFKDRETGTVTFSFTLMLMALMGGVLIPSSNMPPVIRNTGALFPVSWAARGLEELLADGITVQFWLSMLALVLFTAVLILYGSKRKIV